MSAPSVPHPWIAQWDANYNAYYYVNPETNITQWEHPASAPPAYNQQAGGQANSYYGDQKHDYNSQNQYNQQGQYGEAGAPGGAADGERGMGSFLVGAGAGAIGHKIFANKPQQQPQQQYYPPQQGYNPGYGGYPQQQYAPPPNKPSGGMGVGTGLAIGGAAAAGGLLLGKLLSNNNNNSHGGGGHHHGGKYGKHGKHHHHHHC
ncbi:uncharacterized protein LOC62_03G003667 [Vanrija pseudolonga]|uniref:WW domain-containing protein n=1 Tax=Vanrija pseudolonga TaxID=143232 RepID=A0AAF0Y8Y6_9TREE|nr:hypothetical protein LOC62_03G003667 [Vanrija pseudolonga]